MRRVSQRMTRNRKAAHPEAGLLISTFTIKLPACPTYEPREAGNASEFRGLHFLELYCSDCNSKFRLVLQDESASNRACPACGVLAALEIVGHGELTGELRFSQFLHRGPVRLTEEASLGRLYNQEIEQRRGTALRNVRPGSRRFMRCCPSARTRVFISIGMPLLAYILCRFSAIAIQAEP